jgi:sporulation protein YlmC with PRC-barrel domain
MKIDQSTRAEPSAGLEPQTGNRPWWVYVLYAGTDILGKMITAGILTNGRDGHKPAGGVKVNHSGLKPDINPRMITATTVIGEIVIGSDGKQLGKIEEVVLDLTSGTVSYLVLSTGGFLGFRDKFYALPLDSLAISSEEKLCFIDIDQKRLKTIPEIDKRNWPGKSAWHIE